MTHPKPDPIPEGEDEGSDAVPAEDDGPATITITEPTIIVPDDSEGDPA